MFVELQREIRAGAGAQTKKVVLRRRWAVYWGIRTAFLRHTIMEIPKLRFYCMFSFARFTAVVNIVFCLCHTRKIAEDAWLSLNCKSEGKFYSTLYSKSYTTAYFILLD